ncbi:PPPDE putative peptidase domain-containing protein [Spironucleus salmonicida]|nr:PPPDE putative peptidase domain-containing protein [Spironucleus salmonicida]
MKIYNIIYQNSRKKISLINDCYITDNQHTFIFDKQFASLTEINSFISDLSFPIVNIFTKLAIQDSLLYQDLQNKNQIDKLLQSQHVSSFLINVKSPIVGLKFGIQFPKNDIINVFMNENAPNKIINYINRVSLLIQNSSTYDQNKQTATLFFIRKYYRIIKQYQEPNLKRSYSCSNLSQAVLYVPQLLKPLAKVVSSSQQSNFLKYTLKYISLDTKSPVTVFLNLYSLTKVRVGAYHTGIQIQNTEIAYGGHQKNCSGIYFIQPKSNKQFYYQKQIILGQCSLSIVEIITILDNISINWMGKQYNIFAKNCNDFSNQLSLILLQRPIPKWVNNLAQFGRKFI